MCWTAAGTGRHRRSDNSDPPRIRQARARMNRRRRDRRSEEHTSELQSQSNLVCRLLLEKKNIDSAEALQDALEQFDGTLLAVTHDRWFMKGFDRFVVFRHDCSVIEAVDLQRPL